MRTPEERTAELHRRMRSRRAERLHRKTGLISASAYATCLALAALLAIRISSMPLRIAEGYDFGAAGSIFADNATLSVVIAAIAAFCLGAIATALCYRLRKRAEDRDNDR